MYTPNNNVQIPTVLTSKPKPKEPVVPPSPSEEQHPGVQSDVFTELASADISVEPVVEKEEKSLQERIDGLSDVPDMTIPKLQNYSCPVCGTTLKGVLAVTRHMKFYHDTSGPLTNNNVMLRVPTSHELLTAMDAVYAGFSNAARYLNIGTSSFHKYASMLVPKEYEEFKGRKLKDVKNRVGRKPMIRKNEHLAYEHAKSILEGKRASAAWNNTPIRRLCTLFYFELLPECCSICGYDKGRLVDGRVPLLPAFLDGDRFNWSYTNLQVVCYNCYFLEGYAYEGKLWKAAMNVDLEILEKNHKYKSFKQDRIDDI